MREWTEHKLGEFAEIQTGPFGSQLHASDYVTNGIPSIMPTNIGSRLNIVPEGIVYISQADAERLKKYLVRKGDIVYSRRGDVEKCAFITEAHDGSLCGTGCLRIRFFSNELLPKFCAYYLSTPSVNLAWLRDDRISNRARLRRVVCWTYRWELGGSLFWQVTPESLSPRETIGTTYSAAVMTVGSFSSKSVEPFRSCGCSKTASQK